MRRLRAAGKSPGDQCSLHMLKSAAVLLQPIEISRSAGIAMTLLAGKSAFTVRGNSWVEWLLIR